MPKVEESDPVMDAVPEPAMAVSENVVPLKRGKKKGKGLGKKAKAAKVARAPMESQV